ncbi:uncharacterized protein SPAPADRAFT_64653 [Spathaspora passalidarum NRRL Y-27907]|uniref:Uncharacterized protein n=1 Tax=Spathaspora passalidarum (strain NRRL Y-27907 / 11-Y1) TaxID=619300 RepID=G3AE12_SPAPN|nr:uncharacterized protein SPAPADRAFT_64653 [Spathaspora passalidarum NRRL Y-27907]EGW35546.1 hypothetical protein SPAPADRAFT_64653 [Spathaspora passalidarum NRRL Y-27907]
MESINFDWYNIQQGQQLDIQINSMQLGSFELRDDLAYDLCQSYPVHPDSEPVIKFILQIYAHMKLFKQIQSCYQFEPFNHLSHQVSYLPERMDALLNGIGDVKLEYGTFRIKWPLTALKTALLNTNWFYQCMENFCLKLDISFPLCDPPKSGCYKCLFWDDDEGNDKLDTYIKAYMDQFLGKVVSQRHNNEFVVGIPSDKSLSVSEVEGYLPLWFVLEHPEFMNVYSLFMMTRSERSFKFLESSPDTLKALETVGMTLCTCSNDSLIKRLRDISDVYEIGGYNLLGVVNTTGSGQGYMGQLYNHDPFKEVYTPVHDLNEFSKLLGYVLTPARQVNINVKFPVKGGDRKIVLRNFFTRGE